MWAVGLLSALTRRRGNLRKAGLDTPFGAHGSNRVASSTGFEPSLGDSEHDRQKARRNALKTFGLTAGTVILSATGQARAIAAEASTLLPDGASSLAQLVKRLEEAPRRRDFKTVPMILERPDQWDHEALSEVIGYRGGQRQVWDNTEIGGPWLNLMRNSLNAQIWSYKHPEFLVVSATHGSAHLALFEQTMWDKYGLAKLAGDKFTNNSLLDDKSAGSPGVADHENAQGAFSSHDNSIPALQRRGSSFCHAITRFGNWLPG